MRHTTFLRRAAAMMRSTARTAARIMTLLIFILPSFLTAQSARAAAQADWVKTIAMEHTRAARSDTITTTTAPDGSVYLLGDTDGVMPGQTQVGYSDLFLQKYSPAGEVVWTRQFGTTRQDYSVEVLADSSGVYVGGNTVGALAGFWNPDLQIDGVVLKFSPDGDLEWTDQIGTNLNTFLKGIAVTSDSLYVTGWTIGKFDGYPTDHYADGYLRKYSLSGTLQWAKVFGTEHDNKTQDVAADETGAFVSGYYGLNATLKKFSPEGSEIWSSNWMTVDTVNRQENKVAVSGSRVFLAGSIDGAIPGQAPIEKTDGFIMTFDTANGSQGWMSQFGTTGDDFVNNLSVDASGVILGGSTDGSFPSFNNPGSTDGFIRKYSLEGAEGGTFQFGTDGSETVMGTAVDATGIYAAGKTSGALDGQASNGGEDPYLKKIDLSFNPAWTSQLNTTAYVPTYDKAYAVSVNGDIYMAGNINTPPDSSQGLFKSNIYLAKYSPTGDQIWLKQFSSDAGVTSHRFDTALAEAIDPQGDIYLTGYVSGALPGQTNSGLYDAFLSKFDPDGNEVWTRQFGSDNGEEGDKIAIFGSTVYVAGVTAGKMGGAAFGYDDIFIARYNLDGQFLGVEQFGTDNSENLGGLAVDETGLYVAGTTAGTLEGQTSAGVSDGFLRKYNLDGSIAWTKQFGTSTFDGINDVKLYGSKLYVIGTTDGALDGKQNYGQADAFLQRYSLAGEKEWTSIFGYTWMDIGREIVVNANGIYGIWDSTRPLGYTERHTANLSKYTLEGELSWTRPFDNQTEMDTSFGVAVDGDSLYTVGQISTLNHFDSTDAVLTKITLGENQAPVVGAISAPVDPVAVNTPISVSASFTDANTADTHTAVWDWGNGTTSAGTVTESNGSGKVSGGTTYSSPGVYEVKLTVTDQANAKGSASYQYVVVYNPNGGFVTGAGWITSPAGAYVPDPTLAGKATFGFVSRYQKGSTLPTGGTEFHFAVAGLRFQSTSYDWLVIAGTRAQYKGSGTISGDGDYGFLLTAIDGNLTGGDGLDKFRIKIWNKTSGETIYDNQASASESADPNTVLGAGSIKIQK